MKRKELFERSVSVLVKAYQNNTLRHGKCSACAVGNLIAAAKGYKINEKMEWETGWNTKEGLPIIKKPLWQLAFATINRGRNKECFQNMNIWQYFNNSKVKEQIDSTGYSLTELAKIEKAFESASEGCGLLLSDNETWMFNGLIAVYDTLCKIHEVEKNEVKDSKLVFVR